MQFKYDFLIILLPTLVILGLLLRRLLFRNSKKVYYTSNIKLIKSINKHNQLKSIVKFVINIIYYSQAFTIVLLLILLSARPQEAISEDITKEGIDIIILLDSSGSMDQEDIVPSRREAAYEAIRTFVSKPSTNRIGLIAFLGSTAPLVPLTYDHSLISDSLELITFDLFTIREEENGTAVGDALISGVSRFPKESDRTKAIILITDGESTTGVDLEKAGLYTKENNVTVYPLFMSRTNEAGSKDGMLKIAEIFDVPLYEPSNSESMNQILNDIDKLEKNKIETRGNVVMRDNPQPYLYLIGLTVPFFLGTSIIKKYVFS